MTHETVSGPCPYYDRLMHEVSGFAKPGHPVKPARVSIYGTKADDFQVIRGRFEYHPDGTLKAIEYDVILKASLSSTSILCEQVT